MPVTADTLRNDFGFNDPNVIQGILDDPAQVAKYERESGGVAGGGAAGGDLSAPSILDFSNEAFAPVDKALEAYVMALRGRKQPLDVFSELEEAAGLPGMKKTAATLREQIGGLEDTIRRVEGNVTKTTRESLITEGQRAGMVEARQRPLLETLGTITTGLGRISEGITAASSDLATRMQLYLQGQAQALEPFEIMLTNASDKAARQVSGFSQDIQNNLQVLIAKFNRANELSDQETADAFDLLKIEKNYANTLAQMVEQSRIDLEEFSQKKEIEKKFKIPESTGTDTNKYYNPGGAGGSGGSILDLWRNT